MMALGKCVHSVPFDGNKEVEVSYDSEEARKRFSITLKYPFSLDRDATIITDDSDDLRKLAKLINSVADFAENLG